MVAVGNGIHGVILSEMKEVSWGPPNRYNKIGKQEGATAVAVKNINRRVLVLDENERIVMREHMYVCWRNKRNVIVWKSSMIICTPTKYMG